MSAWAIHGLDAGGRAAPGPAPTLPTCCDGLVPPQALPLALQGGDLRVPLRQGLTQHLAVALLQGADLWEEAAHSQRALAQLRHLVLSRSWPEALTALWLGHWRSHELLI